MFGPDVCGGLAEVVLSIRIKDAMYADWKHMIPAPIDTNPHLYRLAWRKDGTYAVYIDGKEVANGNIEDDFDLDNPKTIIDPNYRKPYHPNENVIYKEVAKLSEKLKSVPKMVLDNTSVRPDNWNERL